jgi:diacylglycerol kinase (ATP)
LNKLLFFHYGTRDVWDHACKDLTSCIDLTLDGRPVQLPALEGLGNILMQLIICYCFPGICIMNIGCWGAGVRPWAMLSDAQNTKPHRQDDGLLEVFGLYSSFHIAQLQVLY